MADRIDVTGRSNMSINIENTNIPFIIRGDEETLKKLTQKPSKECIFRSKRNSEIAKKIFKFEKE